MAYNFGNPYSMPNYPAYNAAAYPYTATPQITPQLQPAQNPQNQQNTATQGEPLINGGFIVLPSEEDIKRYPVAPGNLVTFKIENKPVIIEKSMGRSPFDAPHYERYKLIREEMEEEKPETAEESQNEVLHDEIEELKKDISRLDVQIDVLKDNLSEIKKSIKPKTKRAKLNMEDGESEDE